MTVDDSISTRSYDAQELILSSLRDPKAGIYLPKEFGFKRDQDFDQWGRPRHLNLQTVTDFYKRDILAVDRLMLPESNRKMPLFPFQRIILETAARVQFLWLQMMRGGSKTYSLARFALDYALQNANVPIVFTGPSFRQSLLSYDEVLKMIDLNRRNENAPVNIFAELEGDPKRNATESILHLANGSSLRALPMGDGSKIRGIRGGVLILDEFYQMNEEQYESHVMPFVGVKQGGMSSKILHATTSWYQDCFAYRRMMQIASEVKAGNPDYAILDFNLQDLDRSWPTMISEICPDGKFPLDPKIWRDAEQHQSGVQFAMTYFNVWPSTASRWFEQRDIDAATSSAQNVRIEMKRTGAGRYFAVVDVAASETGDFTEVIVWRFEDNKVKAVWGHAEKGLKPNERAWLVHEVRRLFRPEFIIYDSHGAIGVDLKSLLAEKELLVRGTLHRVKPMVHHDAYYVSDADRILIPAAVHDTAVNKALLGPRGGEVRGESGLRDTLFTKTRDLLKAGCIVGPASAKEADENGELFAYNGSEIEVLDVLREAFNQLGNIGIKRDKFDEIELTADGKLIFVTRPGTKDDGAMCIAYGVIGYLRMQGRNGLGFIAPPILRPMEVQRPDGAPIQVPTAKHQRQIW